MSRTRHAIRRHSLGHASCAVQLLAGAGLLTLMPSVMAESPFARALEYAQPLSWVMLAAGVGVLLGQRWLGGKRAPTVGISGTMRDRPVESAAPSAGNSNPSRLDSGVLRRMPESHFDALIEALFAKSGYEVRYRTPLAEGGVDVGLEPRGAMGRQTSLLRCRQRAGKIVSIEDVREFVRAMESGGARNGHFATTSLLTPGTIAFARSRGIHLLDVDGILRMVAKLTLEDQQALSSAAAGDDRTAKPASRAEDGTPAATPDTALPARPAVVQLPERFRADRVAA